MAKKIDWDKKIDRIWDGLSKRYEKLNKKEAENEKLQNRNTGRHGSHG